MEALSDRSDSATRTRVLTRSILADVVAQMDWRMTPFATGIMRWWRPASRDASMQR